MTMTRKVRSIAKVLDTHLPPEEIDAFVRSAADHIKYSEYQENPVGFVKEVLGDVVTDDIRKMMESVRDNQITIARSANATGKAQPVFAPVLTPTGFVWIGSIRPGQTVIGGDGRPCRVTGVFPQGRKPIFRVVMSDGTQSLCTPDHLWACRSSSGKHRGRPYSVMTTAELSRVLHRFMHIPMCGPVEFPRADLPLEPYVLGVLLGDGCLGQGVRLSNPENWIIDKLKTLLPEGVSLNSYYGGSLEHGIAAPPGKRNPIKTILSNLGLIGRKSPQKFIPKKYLLGDVSQRKDLLAGLMDTDGTIDKKSCVIFDTSSRQLSDDVRWLVMSLGGTAKLRPKKAPVYHHNGETRHGLPDYRLFIKLPFCPFTLPRKAKRWRNPLEMQKQAHRLVKKIEPAGFAECVCISVDNKDGLYLTNDFIVTHNSHGAARVAVWWYKCFSDSQVFTAAAPPFENLSHILWGQIGEIVAKHPELFDTDRQTSLHLERHPRSFLTGLTIPSSGTDAQRQAKFSGKHAPHLLFILDEGDAIPDPVYAGIESCMSGGHARLLVMHNPRHQEGAPYRMERDGLANVIEISALNHPNVIYGRDVIPGGAVSCDLTVQRINKYCRPIRPGETPDENYFLLPKYLEYVDAPRESGGRYDPLQPGWYRVVEQVFWTLVLGKYPQQAEDQLIARSWVEAARSRWDVYVAANGEHPPDGVAGIQGVDVAEYGPDLSVVCHRFGGFVERLLTKSSMDPLEVGDWAATEAKRRRIQCSHVDGTGVGAGVAPQMIRNGCLAAGLKVATKPTATSELGEFTILRDQLGWACREWLRTDPGSMLPPDEELIEELLAFTYTTVNGRVRITPTDQIKDQIKRSPDRAMALFFTFADPLSGAAVGPMEVSEQAKRKAVIKRRASVV